MKEECLICASSPERFITSDYVIILTDIIGIEFILQIDNSIYPLEAKSGEAVKAASVKRYAGMFREETPLVVRLSLKNLRLDGNILNVPLFMVDHLDSLIRTAQKGQVEESGSIT